MRQALRTSASASLLIEMGFIRCIARARTAPAGVSRLGFDADRYRLRRTLVPIVCFKNFSVVLYSCARHRLISWTENFSWTENLVICAQTLMTPHEVHGRKVIFVATHETPPLLTQRRFVSSALGVSKQLGAAASIGGSTMIFQLMSSSHMTNAAVCVVTDQPLLVGVTTTYRATKCPQKKFITVYNFFRNWLENRSHLNRLIFKGYWWAHQGSNLGPAD